MGRELRRVPMDFSWPLDRVWDGYLPSAAGAEYRECPHWHAHHEADDEHVKAFCNPCPECDGKCKECDGDVDTYVKPDGTLWKATPPPAGPGYQMWETTSEGSPQSPVFATLDELCVWCERNATTFADFRATADRWREMLDDGLVGHQSGSVFFC